MVASCMEWVVKVYTYQIEIVSKKRMYMQEISTWKTLTTSLKVMLGKRRVEAITSL